MKYSVSNDVFSGRTARTWMPNEFQKIAIITLGVLISYFATSGASASGENHILECVV
jgi:hypothetical protein